MNENNNDGEKNNNKGFKYIYNLRRISKSNSVQCYGKINYYFKDTAKNTLWYRE